MNIRHTVSCRAMMDKLGQVVDMPVNMMSTCALGRVRVAGYGSIIDGMGSIMQSIMDPVPLA